MSDMKWFSRNESDVQEIPMQASSALSLVRSHPSPHDALPSDLKKVKSIRAGGSLMAKRAVLFRS
jgi:hypothetical protein